MAEEDDTTLNIPHVHRRREQGPHAAHLIVLNGADVGRVYPLSRSRTDIGRDVTADIQILDVGLSRKHATIERRSDGLEYIVRDLDSKNGTFANNQRLKKPHVLSDGDRLQIGSTTILKFAQYDAVESDYAQRMYDAALRDDLTGLFNRRYFDQRLGSEIAYATRHDAPRVTICWPSIQSTHP